MGMARGHHAMFPSGQRGTWGGVGLDHVNRLRHGHPLMWPSQGVVIPEIWVAVDGR